jgi:hypothetical protein
MFLAGSSQLTFVRHTDHGVPRSLEDELASLQQRRIDACTQNESHSNFQS